MNDIIDARCGWAGSDELYIKYHDEEWGRPVTDDRTCSNFWYSKAPRQGCPGLQSSANAKVTERLSTTSTYSGWHA